MLSTHKIIQNTVTLSIVALSCVWIPTTSAGNGTSKHVPQETYPKFYLSSRINNCRLDSPELFYYRVALPSINSLHEEGKIFFGVLMDRLESSLAGTEKYEYLSKEWTFLMDIINESFALAVGRIDIVWDAIIDQNDVTLLPWEAGLHKIFLLELFDNLMNEYLVVEAVVRAGTKEIVNTLQKYLMEVMELLEDKVYYQSSPEGDPLTESQLLDRMEKASSKLEPNFVGALLQKLLQKAKTRDLHSWKSSSVNFLAAPMEEIAITIASFKDAPEPHPFFWSQMTDLLKSVNGSVIMETQDVYELYLGNEELVLESVIGLLTMDLQQ